MVKRSAKIFISLFIFLAIVPAARRLPGAAAAVGAGSGENAYTREVEFYDTDASDEYVQISAIEYKFATDFWHYSVDAGGDGYWMDGKMEEAKIYDYDPNFWDEPYHYYDRKSMRINAEAQIPSEIVNYINKGTFIAVRVKPKHPDSINSEKETPTYSINGNKITIHALPLFIVDAENSYKKYIKNLDHYIPIVEKGYGYNIYALYQNDSKIGSLQSTYAYEDNKIDYRELINKRGDLNSARNFDIRNPETNIVKNYQADEIKIGGDEDTFNTAGAVGMWFEYEFRVEFYRQKPGDLLIESIKAPKTVEAGAGAECEITVRNDSDISYTGANAPKLRLRNGRSDYETDVELLPNSEKTVTMKWTAPEETGTYKLVATINPDHAIEETDYENNIASQSVIVAPAAEEAQPAPTPHPIATPPPLPDLSVTGFRDTDYTALKTVRSFVRVKNDGAVSQRNVRLAMDCGYATLSRYVDFSPGEEKEVEFEWLTPQNPGTINISAEINPDRTVAEYDYSNNKRVFSVRIGAPPVDLSVTALTPSRFPAGKQVLTLVNVYNNGDRDFSGGEAVDVTLSIPSISYNSTRRVNIDMNSNQVVNFLWNAPVSAGNFQMTATVNQSRTIPETNYANNSMTINAESTDSGTPAYGCNTTLRRWSVRRNTGTQTVMTPAPDGTLVPVRKPVYTTYNFYAQVSISARLVPGTIKSGYGVECEVTTTFDTNYDRDDATAPIQEVYAYMPAEAGGGAIRLERVPGSVNKWRFPVNTASVAGSRAQYVPVNWPDGKAFKIGFTGRDAQCPDGALCASTTAQATVSGNMYQDDYTAPLY